MSLPCWQVFAGRWAFRRRQCSRSLARLGTPRNVVGWGEAGGYPKGEPPPSRQSLTLLFLSIVADSAPPGKDDAVLLTSIPVLHGHHTELAGPGALG